MPLELERRFLVVNYNWKQHVNNVTSIRQGYLASNPSEWTTRIRIIEKKKAWLTLKKKSQGIANYEFEYKIPLDEAEQILGLSPHKVVKTRYYLNINNISWVVDCFEKENNPLVLAEIELDSDEEIRTKPTWCGTEITNQYEWSNAALAKEPISKWPISKRKKYNL